MAIYQESHFLIVLECQKMYKVKLIVARIHGCMSGLKKSVDQAQLKQFIDRNMIHVMC